MTRLFFFFIVFTINRTNGQTVVPCGLDYGSVSDENNVSQQMRYGSIIDAQNAIQLAKNTRGTSLGCPQISYNRTLGNLTEPTLTNVTDIWNSNHSPIIQSYSVSCPRIGRYENNAALGAYYAKLTGNYSDLLSLEEIATMMYDQQYATWNISSPDLRNEGVFGYVNLPNTDPCYPGGIVGSSVTSLCTTLPVYCVDYSSNQFAGMSFAISGQDDANNWFDGGLAYDHGWASIQMIEAGIGQTNPLLKLKYRNSALKASQYAISEFCVKNHNYTSKLIWTLAQMYNWTGDPIYMNELNYKLDKNLLPGILMDVDLDGFVDGTTPPISFSSLIEAAQTPGRMWDGHNSLPWYQSMNAWALTDAYVAFRDRGDNVRASELKPYVIAMLDNVSDEILNFGAIDDQLGVRDVAYALLNGIWKISQYENENHDNWKNAAWIMWNTGYFDAYSTHSVCVGMYLVVLSNAPYVPLFLREDFALSMNDVYTNNSITISPNPSSSFIEIKGISSTIENIQVLTMSGSELSQPMIFDGNKLLIEKLDKGIYLIKCTDNVGNHMVKRFVKD